MKSILLILCFPLILCNPDTFREPMEPYSKQSWDFQFKGSNDQRLGYLIVLHPTVNQNLFLNEDHYFQFWNDALIDLKREGYLIPEKTLIFLGDHLSDELFLSGLTVSKNESNPLDLGLFQNLKRKVLACRHFTCSLEEAVLRQSARNTAVIFQSVWSRLASTFRINIIPGSIDLPNVEIKEKRMIVRDGEIESFSTFFDVEGNIHSFENSSCYPLKWGKVCQNNRSYYTASILLTDGSYSENQLTGGFTKNIFKKKFQKNSEVKLPVLKSFNLAHQSKSSAIIIPIESAKKP